MESSTNGSEKKPRPSKQTQSVSLNIRRETRKRIQTELARANKKDYGRTVSADDYIAMAIGLMTPEHIKQLQEASLSNADRFERDYRRYVATAGHISKDAYLGLRLKGEAQTAGSTADNKIETQA